MGYRLLIRASDGLRYRLWIDEKELCLQYKKEMRAVFLMEQVHAQAGDFWRELIHNIDLFLPAPPRTSVPFEVQVGLDQDDRSGNKSLSLRIDEEGIKLRFLPGQFGFEASWGDNPPDVENALQNVIYRIGEFVERNKEEKNTGVVIARIDPRDEGASFQSNVSAG